MTAVMPDHTKSFPFSTAPGAAPADVKTGTGIMNILILYDDRNTYVKTIAEHLEAFAKHSKHNISYLAATGVFPEFKNEAPVTWDFSGFDAVIQHYSVRSVLKDHMNARIAAALSAYDGVKIMFIQDEYEATETARLWMERIGFDIVFTCVPEESRDLIYPPPRFPKTKFVQTLTGFVPDDDAVEVFALPMNERKIRIAYRGRTLPHHYGRLGRDKYEIGERVRVYARKGGIPVDISLDEHARIYGNGWYRFLGSARATLGTESGANVFDFDGTLKDLARAEANLPFDDFQARYLVGLENQVKMNQISPKVFEAIRLRVALILLEGDYSGVVKPHLHYLPLKKDYSNLDEIFASFEDVAFLEELTARAYQDIIASGRYSYAQFVSAFDETIAAFSSPARRSEVAPVPFSGASPLMALFSTRIITGTGEREKRLAAMAQKLGLPFSQHEIWMPDIYRPIQLSGRLKRMLYPFWQRLPERLQARLKPLAQLLLRRR